MRRKTPAVVIVLDNGGYDTERLLHPGDYRFNDVQPWAFSKLPEVLGGGTGYEVRTEGEFDAALNAAWADKSGPSIIHARLVKGDASDALKNLGQRMQRTVLGK